MNAYNDEGPTRGSEIAEASYRAEANQISWQDMEGSISSSGYIVG
jgi:hypothetical protein